MIRHIAGAAAPPDGPYDADVIILALDRIDDTLAAIRSASEQTGVRRHITVLDQGSRYANLARLADAVRGRDDAGLWRAEHNLGVAGGRNHATAIGHGRIIAALDNDAVFGTDRTLAGMVAALDTAPELAAIGCRILRDADGSDDLTSWGYPAALLPRAGACFPATTFVGAGHAIRRAAWQAAGGYDAALFFCWEEFDFCLRAIAQGWQIAYRGDLIIRHKVSAEQRAHWSGSRWFHFVRNRLYIGRKYGVSWLGLSPRILAYLVKGTRNGLLLPTLRAIPAAAAMRPDRRPGAMSRRVRTYLQRHDAAHRGSLWQRLRTEVLGHLTHPDAAPAAPPHPP